MRRFLIKLTVFIAFPTLYFGTNMAINRYIYDNQTIPIKNKRVLIAGDSHAQQSINPQYFVSAQNISKSAEPYVLTYWKLKKIFKSIIPDTLILAFAPHNISQFNDLKFSDDRWASEMFKRSYPIEEYNEISKIIPVDYRTFYKVLWKQTAFYPKENHINYIGKYSNNKTSNISNWSPSIQLHYYHEGKELGVSELAINYLDSIIELCNSKNIKLVFVSNPVHQKYLENIPSNIMTKYINLTNKYNKCHIVFDKTRDKYVDSLYLNSDHLNENGAKIFTLELIKHLNNKAGKKAKTNVSL